MSGYHDFPPVDIFKRILRNLPQSADLYARLWKMKAQTKLASKRIAIKRSDIKKMFLISPTLFRNHLLSLGRMDLVSFEENSDFFLIDFHEQNEL